MALTAFRTDTGTTITTTEYDLVDDANFTAADTTDDGAFSLILDVSAMVAGDEFQVCKYEKGHASDTAVKQVLANLRGVIPGGNFETPSFTMGHGWTFTIKRIAGSDRSIGWTIWQWT